MLQDGKAGMYGRPPATGRQSGPARRCISRVALGARSPPGPGDGGPGDEGWRRARRSAPIRRKCQNPTDLQTADLPDFPLVSSQLRRTAPTDAARRRVQRRDDRTAGGRPGRARRQAPGSRIAVNVDRDGEGRAPAQRRTCPHGGARGPDSQQHVGEPGHLSRREGVLPYSPSCRASMARVSPSSESSLTKMLGTTPPTSTSSQ